MLTPSSPYETYSQAIVRPTFQQSQGLSYAQPAPYTPYAQPQRPNVWETYRAMLAPQPEPFSPMQSAVTGLRHNGEGMAIAALLALYQRHVGDLDFRGKYPIDGILGALLLAFSVKEAGKPDGYASDLRALSQSCTSVMMFRKVLGDGAKAKIAGESKGNSELPLYSGNIPRNTDPILEAARKHGF